MRDRETYRIRIWEMKIFSWYQVVVEPDANYACTIYPTGEDLDIYSSNIYFGEVI